MGSTRTPGIYIFDGQFKIMSNVTGNRIENTPDEIAGYNSSGTKQFYLQASDGKAMCGGGVLELDADGIDIAVTTSTSDVRSYKFNDGGTVIGGLYAYKDGSSYLFELIAGEVAAKNHYMEVESDSPATYIAQTQIRATSGATTVYMTLKADSNAGTPAFGTLTGASYFNFVSCDVYAQSFSTDGGTTKWELMQRHAAAIYSTDGYVEIEINGTSWKLLQGTFT
jgi:hypothetical protein